MIKFLFFILFLLGCQNKVSTQGFFDELYPITFLTETFETVWPFEENNPISFENPTGTWITIFKFYAPKNQLEDGDHCLLYKIPLKEGEGILKIIKSINNVDCETAHFKKLGEKNILIDGISGLKAQLEMVKIPEKSFEEGLSIKIEFFKDKTKHAFSLPLYNYQGKGVGKTKFRDLPSPSFKILGFIDNQISMKSVSKPSYIGSELDTFLDNPESVCELVDENCKVTKKFDCEACRYGVNYILVPGCVGLTIKYCGPERCGYKGSPACIRGTKFQKNILDNCGPVLNIGLCQEDLLVTCDKSGALMCI